ncbi:MAG: molybdate ABC transporter substrate-binding protein [Pirellulaceae bacterium]|jgi:molybdenum ABC transporter molybdate-binding protein|nr:molybdate ABC transporter substrate-binding protein [Pirellulaceae bacterium]
MQAKATRFGRINPLLAILVGAFSAVVLLCGMLISNGRKGRSGADGVSSLTVYCAAGMRYPMVEIAEEYEREYGVKINLDYGGSNVLLSRLEVGKTGDLYLAGDASYVEKAKEKGLAAESISLALMRPVLVVDKNENSISKIEDLLKENVRLAIGDPDAAAVGKKTRKLLTASGHWEQIEARVKETGVYLDTVNKVANTVQVSTGKGVVWAGIVWDSTAHQYPDLAAIRTPELDAGEAEVQITVLKSSQAPTAALRFARFVAAKDRGLKTFQKHGFDVVDGDKWAVAPEITFFAGAVNRMALESVIERFAEREGVEINTIYNGCGILTSQMKTIDGEGGAGFPDMFMACDVFYLDVVKDMFLDGTNVSETDIVMVVAKGNPLKIATTSDLNRKGMRVAIGRPNQCTIGVLTKQLLEEQGLYAKLFADNNIVTEAPSSAMLVPTITTDAADVALAYATDTLAEAERIDVVLIDSASARAVQPYSVAQSSDYKQLGQRLFEAISQSRDDFEAAGFRWRLDDDTADVSTPSEQREPQS